MAVRVVAFGSVWPRSMFLMATSEMLDASDPIEGSYRLEVSSPGIDRPLTRLKDFADWSGHEARITLRDPRGERKQFKGDLAGVDGETIAITDGQGVTHAIAFASIEDAKLVITNRLIAATRPLSTEGADEFEAEEQD